MNVDTSNGTVSSDTDSIGINIIEIAHSPNIVATQDQSRLAKVLYTRSIQQDNFTIVVQFDSVYQRRTFYNWIKAWLYTMQAGTSATATSATTTPTNSSSTTSQADLAIVNAGLSGAASLSGHTNLLRVQGPNGFDFTGCPAMGMTEETKVTDVTWKMQLHFIGAVPTINNNPVTPSAFQAPKVSDTANQYYYPDSIQLTGADAVQADVDIALYGQATGAGALGQQVAGKAQNILKQAGL